MFHRNHLFWLNCFFELLKSSDFLTQDINMRILFWQNTARRHKGFHVARDVLSSSVKEQCLPTTNLHCWQKVFKLMYLFKQLPSKHIEAALLMCSCMTWWGPSEGASNNLVSLLFSSYPFLWDYHAKNEDELYLLLFLNLYFEVIDKEV